MIYNHIADLITSPEGGDAPLREMRSHFSSVVPRVAFSVDPIDSVRNEFARRAAASMRAGSTQGGMSSQGEQK